MSKIELGPLRPVGAVDVRVARQAGAMNEKPKQAATPAPTVVKSEALDPGSAPVDAERVEVIKKAVESGNYPLVPARIADAMIAAEMLLRSAK